MGLNLALYQWNYLQKILDEGVSCMCGKKLDNDVEMYPHSDGIVVPFEDAKQWVYVTCKKCGHQNSHVKIIQRYEMWCKHNRKAANKAIQNARRREQ